MKPELIVMLTLNDRTVPEATETFEACASLPVKLWGFKDVGIPFEQMQTLAATMRAAGKTVYIESLESEEYACLQSAETAVACGADVMSGGRYYDRVRDYLHTHGLGYEPSIGTIVGRPAVLQGTIEEMANEAALLKRNGVDGVDLASYRYAGDPVALMRAVTACGVSVCVAGSIDSRQRLLEITDCGIHRFTIGSAFFHHKFGDTFEDQICAVLDILDSL